MKINIYIKQTIEVDDDMTDEEINEYLDSCLSSTNGKCVAWEHPETALNSYKYRIEINDSGEDFF